MQWQHSHSPLSNVSPTGCQGFASGLECMNDSAVPCRQARWFLVPFLACMYLQVFLKSMSACASRLGLKSSGAHRMKAAHLHLDFFRHLPPPSFVRSPHLSSIFPQSHFGVDHCEIKICTASTERRLGPNLSVAASWKNFRVCWRIAISSLASGNLRLRRSGMKYVPIRLVRVLLLTST